VDSVKITSWNTGVNNIIPQEPQGSIERAYMQLNGSEGGLILNSEIAYLGQAEPGKRGIDLYGVLPSHGFSIVNSKIHHLFHALIRTPGATTSGSSATTSTTTPGSASSAPWTAAMSWWKITGCTTTARSG
jgi:hypothetical protein